MIHLICEGIITHKKKKKSHFQSFFNASYFFLSCSKDRTNVQSIRSLPKGKGCQMVNANFHSLEISINDATYAVTIAVDDTVDNIAKYGPFELSLQRSIGQPIVCKNTVCDSVKSLLYGRPITNYITNWIFSTTSCTATSHCTTTISSPYVAAATVNALPLLLDPTITESNLFLLVPTSPENGSPLQQIVSSTCPSSGLTADQCDWSMAKCSITSKLTYNPTTYGYNSEPTGFSCSPCTDLSNCNAFYTTAAANGESLYMGVDVSGSTTSNTYEAILVDAQNCMNSSSYQCVWTLTELKGEYQSILERDEKNIIEKIK